MQTKTIFATITCLLLSFIVTAQTHNPYKEIGKKGKVLTLTNGEYDEFFDEDSIQRIGSAFVNINTMQVVKVQLTREEQRQLDNSLVSRFLSVDPLTNKFASLTPYQYASNSPIAGIDLDGLEFANAYSRLKGAIIGVTALKVNNLSDGFGDVQEQLYRINIDNPQKNPDELYKQVSSNINSIYGTKEGSFEYKVQQKPNEVSKNDLVQIDPGLKGFDMFVKVANIQKIDANNKEPGIDNPHNGFSITFRTLQGHVEVGVITFTALEMTNPQTGAKSFQFDISSTSRINHLTGSVLNGTIGLARDKQNSVWHQVLQNIYNYVGGTVSNASQSISNYEYSQYEDCDNNGTTLGQPKPLQSPVTTHTDIKIEPKKD